MQKYLEMCIKQHQSFYLVKKYMPENLQNSKEANRVFDKSEVL